MPDGLPWPGHAVKRIVGPLLSLPLAHHWDQPNRQSPHTRQRDLFA